jgi:hypothetical protein
MGPSSSSYREHERDTEAVGEGRFRRGGAAPAASGSRAALLACLRTTSAARPDLRLAVAPWPRAPAASRWRLRRTGASVELWLRRGGAVALQRWGACTAWLGAAMAKDREQRWSLHRRQWWPRPRWCARAWAQTARQIEGMRARVESSGSACCRPTRERKSEPRRSTRQQWWGALSCMNATSRTRVSTTALRRTPGVRCCGHLGAPFWAIYGLNCAMGLKPKLEPTRSSTFFIKEPR